MEDRTLDYKRQLPDFSDKKQKRKFLGIVSSFANTVGGDLIYGISDLEENGRNTGKPGKAIGLSLENPEKTILLIKDLIINNIEPRIVPQVVAKSIPGFELGPVIVIRIRRSATGPHAVWMDKKALFYVRSSNSTDLMDVNEIRMSFTMKESVFDRIKAFRQERIDKILAADTPTLLESGPKLVLHILPIEAFDPLSHRNIVDESYSIWQSLIPSQSSGGANKRFNFEGLLIYLTTRQDNTTPAYCQLFEDGKIEIVNTRIGFESKNDRFIFRDFDKSVFLDTKIYINHLVTTGVTCPLIVMVSFLSVFNYCISYQLDFGRRAGEPLDRDNLLLPEVFVNSFEEDPESFLKPTMDSFWRACGFQRNLNYNENGERVA